MDARRTLVSYWERAVGIGQWLRPWQEPVADSYPALFLWEGASVELSAVESQLLEKVIAALKLDANDVGVLATTLQELPSVLVELEKAKWILSFSHELGDFLAANFPRMQVVVLPTLTEMQNDPAAKKQAWDLLKKSVLTTT